MREVGLLLLAALAGCGAPPGGGDEASVPIDAAVPGDLAAGCAPACAGSTPHCNPQRKCVACVDDTHCPLGTYCKAVSDAASTCAQGCSSDDRCRGDGGSGACCGNLCTDTATDPRHCGACGMACAAVHAKVSCAGGQCATGACDPGWGDCNADPKDGCEVNLRADPAHCTKCGTACAIPNAVAGCASGCYMAACKFGFDDCNQNVNDGCETQVIADARNCGACGKSCASVPNAMAGCVNGSCVLAACNAGYRDCDGNAQNGCEVRVDNNAMHCGACGNACGQGLVCVSSNCTCPQCNIPNASATCVNNMCVLDKCNPGFANCDGNAQNGCEAGILFDARNCNGCGNACPMNAPNCVNGQCGVVDLSGKFAEFTSEGRRVYLWKTSQCAVLANHTNFCPMRGLTWWRPKSQADANMLIQFAYNLDMTHTWVQVHGLTTTLGTIGGFPVTVDSANCVEGSNSGWAAFRKWACSFCDPESNAMQQNNGQSCCWDKGHAYDWFVCEG